MYIYIYSGAWAGSDTPPSPGVQPINDFVSWHACDRTCARSESPGGFIANGFVPHSLSLLSWKACPSPSGDYVFTFARKMKVRGDPNEIM